MSAYKSRAPTGTAPTTTGQGTTVKSVASAAGIAKRASGAALDQVGPINPILKPVQDQTKLNKQGVQNDDAGNINPRLRR
jgi:hypothetical protein